MIDATCISLVQLVCKPGHGWLVHEVLVMVMPKFGGHGEFYHMMQGLNMFEDNLEIGLELDV